MRMRQAQASLPQNRQTPQQSQQPQRPQDLGSALPGLARSGMGIAAGMGPGLIGASLPFVTPMITNALFGKNNNDYSGGNATNIERQNLIDSYLNPGAGAKYGAAPGQNVNDPTYQRNLDAANYNQQYLGQARQAVMNGQALPQYNNPAMQAFNPQVGSTTPSSQGPMTILPQQNMDPNAPFRPGGANYKPTAQPLDPLTMALYRSQGIGQNL